METQVPWTFGFLSAPLRFIITIVFNFLDIVPLSSSSKAFTIEFNQGNSSLSEQVEMTMSKTGTSVV